MGVRFDVYLIIRSIILSIKIIYKLIFLNKNKK